MKIETQDVKVTFSFTPRTHFLVFDSVREEWSLNPRIDRSEKGKSDDVGVPEVYLSKSEAEECKRLGFSYII